MTRCDVKNKIISVLEQDILHRSISNINEETSLGEGGLGIDSLNFLKLLTVLEKTFNEVIEDDYWDYNKMKSISDLVDYFYQNLQGAI